MKTTPSISYQCSPEDGELAINSLVFKNWIRKVNPLFEITSIVVTIVDTHSSSPKKEGVDERRVLFIRLRVKTSNSPREQIVELRGGAVAMLVNLICNETGTVYTVLVKQARLATGSIDFIEVPAGMIDDDNFKGAAAREIEEELGLVFGHSDLVDITPPTAQDLGLYLSPGLLDESCKFYLAEKNVSPQELKDLEGKTCGVAHEGEFITLMIIPLETLPTVTHDAKTIVAWALYHQYKKMKK